MSVLNAVRLPRDEAPSGWYEILPAPAPARSLDDDLAFDWIVVGAGFAGLSAARRLSELASGDRIAVIDAQRVGWGAAGRNSGFMIDLPHELKGSGYGGGSEEDHRQIRMNRAGIAYAQATARAFGLQEHVNACGKYHGATDGHGLQALNDFVDHLRALEEPFTELDGAGMKRLTGTDYYAGGIHTPGAVMIQPAAYIRGLAKGLEDKVAIFENSPVQRIALGGEHKVYASGGSLTARNIISPDQGRANRGPEHLYLQSGHADLAFGG